MNKSKKVKRASYLTTKDVAAACGVSPMSVTRWCDDGKGPKHHRTPGGLRRFARADVVAWMKERGMPVPKGFE